MNFNAIIFRDDEDGVIHQFLLDENFMPLPLPSIPLLDGYVDKKLTKDTFYIANIELVPNENFRGELRTLGDLTDNFDFMLCKSNLYQMTSKEKLTVHESIRQGKFWGYVFKIVKSENLREEFGDIQDDPIGDLMTGGAE